MLLFPVFIFWRYNTYFTFIASTNITLVIVLHVPEKSGRVVGVSMYVASSWFLLWRSWNPTLDPDCKHHKESPQAGLVLLARSLYLTHSRARVNYYTKERTRLLWNVLPPGKQQDGLDYSLGGDAGNCLMRAWWCLLSEFCNVQMGALAGFSIL